MKKEQEKKPPCYFEAIINKDGCSGYTKSLTGENQCRKCRFFRRGTMAKSKRAKACDISMDTKIKVFERDRGRCVVCGNNHNVMPNAHYIPRSKGGLGIEQNIVTLCTNFTDNKCHYKFDFGTAEERQEIGAKIWEYLLTKYPGLIEEDLYYKKY